MALGFGLFTILSALLSHQVGADLGLGPGLEQLVLSFDNNNMSSNGCNLYKGRWVFDKKYPMYDSSTCPFAGGGFDCLKNGRPDKNYLKYKWKPLQCDLPRFDGRDFLERYRGKKVMFVGDSLSRNMWESLGCMLHAAVPYSNYTILERGLLSTLSFPEYETSVTWMKNGFLVDLVNEKIGKVLKLDSISYGESWKGVDLLIFNSYHWWTHTGRMQSWNFFEVGGKIIKDMDHMQAYLVALKTWAKWIDSNIDPSKTKVYFQGIAASHTDGKEWDPDAQNCKGETEPVKGSVYPGPGVLGEMIIRSVLTNMKSPVNLLDITVLTQLRKDGHPSVYTARGPSFVDCSHWCVAGVPDTWNQLLYATLLDHNYSIPPSPKLINRHIIGSNGTAISFSIFSLSISFLFSLFFFFLYW